MGGRRVEEQAPNNRQQVNVTPDAHGGHLSTVEGIDCMSGVLATVGSQLNVWNSGEASFPLTRKISCTFASSKFLPIYNQFHFQPTFKALNEVVYIKKELERNYLTQTMAGFYKFCRNHNAFNMQNTFSKCML